MNYIKHYIKLIRNAKQRITNENDYYEKHHFFPNSIYGKNSKIVYLTYREHYIAHLLLYKIYKKRYGNYNIKTKKMLYAFNMMSNRFTLNNRSYLKTRKEYSNMIAIKNKERDITGDRNPAKNIEVRKKISKSKKGKKRFDMKGKKYFGADEEKIKIGILKMTESKKGMRIYNNGIEERMFYDDEILEGFCKGRLKENIKHLSIPCSEEKKKKISQVRQKTNEKYINMTYDEFFNWIADIEKRNTLWRKHSFHSNITKAIRARGEDIKYYEKLFPRRN